MSDLSALTQIYNHYVMHSHAVFDEHPVTLEQRKTWFEQYADTGPHRLLIAVHEERVCGWASSQTFRAHPAFRECTETSIMLAPDAHGLGFGTALYTRLFAELAHTPLHRLYAGVALPNAASCRLHEKLGFRRIGVYEQYAIKHGTRISSAWYERANR